MVVKYWWLGLALLVIVLAVSAWRYFTCLTRGKGGRDALWLAHTDRVRQLPRYQFLARRRVRWLSIEVGFTVVALIGALAMVSRPMAVANDSSEMRSRDVMLCLDVSGSMTRADATIIQTYIQLVGSLKGERIGMVLFNSSGSMAFPLTDDYVFVEEQLRSVLDWINTNSVFPSSQASGGTGLDGQAIIKGASAGNGSSGSSLIGDGLMSCLLRFDQQAQERPRTVILATDNELAGTPIFTLQEAGQKAVTDHVLVYAISPPLSDSSAKTELRSVAESTGGQLLELNNDPAMTARIVEGIRRQQQKAIMGMSSARSFDLVWPGAVTMGVGLLGMLATVRKTRL